MVTITAPGVEINELDLSQYTVDKQTEDTQNILVTGFASKGKMNSPYEFTSNNTDSDLIEVFGTPTNEAERYFYNTCSEIIKRDKIKLYAARLPYAPEHDEYNIASYTLNATDVRLTSTMLTGDLAPYAVIANADKTLSAKYIIDISSDAAQPCIGIDTLDNYRQGKLIPGANKFIIVDKTQNIYKQIPADSMHSTEQSRYMIGTLPIVTTAANALYFQKLIENKDSDLSAFESVSQIFAFNRTNALSSVEMVYPACSLQLPLGNTNAQTISKLAAQHFPTININKDGSFQRDDLMNIGIVVFTGFIDSEYNNIIHYEPVESFAGSLNHDSIDSVTGASRFIDDIVNTNSQYIEFYSNCFNSKMIVDSTVESDDPIEYDYDEAGILLMRNQSVDALGFEKFDDTNKTISTDRIMTSLDQTFEKCKNVKAMKIDLLVDAGVSNIAQFMHSVNLNSKWIENYDLTKIVGDKKAAELWRICDISGASNFAYVTKWQTVLKKFDDFCKIRKDCMFIADGLRPLCLTGNAKRVMNDNYRRTVANTILPDMKHIANKINTSYGSGYCNWYKVIDPTSGVQIWMPPSSKVVLTYIDTANNYDYWTAPAGITYGRMNPDNDVGLIKVVDIAFDPTTQEAGDIYTKQWNYASKYYDVGFVIEGQKTFQIRQTAFDRVNVRRLFLYLERKVYNAAKYFIYQGNTAYTRQRLIDAITPYFEDAKVRGGLYDYRIQCDEKNNTSKTIDANELHVKIAIKPTKTIEFIECTFVALKTGASFTEVGMED